MYKNKIRTQTHTRTVRIEMDPHRNHRLKELLEKRN